MVRLKKIALEDFKGVKSAEYSFDSDVIKVSGKNGCGKTTIATAYFWLLINKDYSLKDNPNIRPNNMEESLPKVTATVDLDGKEITLSKSQTMKKSKPDENGICKVSLTNSYEINSVPKTERDFKAYLLEEMGIDTDLIAELSHPDVFTKNIGDKKQRDHVRETLFKMCKEVSDLDIAKLGSDTQEVAKLLENYKMDEIKAMYSASKKKANDNINSIPMQIVGMEKAKVDFDAAELELEKNDLIAKIEDTKIKIETSSNKAEIDKLESEKFALQFDINELIRKANEENFKLKAQLNDRAFGLKGMIRELENQLSEANSNKATYESRIERFKQEIEEKRTEWHKQSDVEFDESIYDFNENDEYCRSCGQRLPIDKIDELRKNNELAKESARNQFEARKKQLLDEISNQGVALKDNIKIYTEKLKAINITSIDNQLSSIKAELDEVNEKISNIPESVDMSLNVEYLALMNKDKELSEKIEILKNSTVDTSDLNLQLVGLNSQLKDVEAKISQFQNNANIDEKIAELQALALEYEQSKADAEKILYQVDLVNKKKNELCEEEINKNFSMVKFKLFDYQKNGEYKESCIPMSLDNKPMYESTNTALEVLMKLDIASSLQGFYGMHLPIFLDNAECLDDRNLKSIKSDSQMILLCVTNDELKVEVM